jgi:hypothetical protein
VTKAKKIVASIKNQDIKIKGEILLNHSTDGELVAIDQQLAHL